MSTHQDLLEAIGTLLGPKGVVTDAAATEPYLVEERGRFRGTAALVVRPASTEEVSQVVRLCAGAGVAVVPQAGNTGLSGGGVPDGGVVLSLERMDRILEVDAVDRTMTVEAGCILANVQAAADAAGALFPLSLGAEGSCRIGGNISTNAGGVHVLRYGTMRDLVLGLQVVLPDGRVWDGLRRLRKDNTGYDMKQVFIGAEGTLGVITAAVLKLFPKPKAREAGLAACADVEALLELFDRVQGETGADLNAFEVWARVGMDMALAHVPGVVDPLAEPHPYYALVELASARSGADLKATLESVLGQALEDGVVADATVAASDGQIVDLWRIREAIPEAQKHEGGSIKHDVSVPVSRVPEFLRRAGALVEAEVPGIRVVAFGHLGDGNIHFNLSQPMGADRDAFMAEGRRVTARVHELIAELGGSFSAEHGIGRLRLDDMERFKPPVELDLMRALKKALDPLGLMNPGKVLR